MNTHLSTEKNPMPGAPPQPQFPYQDDPVSHSNEIYKQEVDIFAPYALGAVINDETVPQLRAKIVAGSANNIFGEDRHGDELQRRGIVYAVDYVANSGGTIFDTDRLCEGRFQPDRAWENVKKIYERIEEIFRIADRDHITRQRIGWPKKESPLSRRSAY